MEIEIESIVKQVYLLVPRLERLTPDSSFAHQASGYRRTLLRLVHKIETDFLSNPYSYNFAKSNDFYSNYFQLKQALAFSFSLIEKAAKKKIE